MLEQPDHGVVMEIKNTLIYSYAMFNPLSEKYFPDIIYKRRVYLALHK